MSLLVLGVSHHTAPLHLLETLAEDVDRSAAIASTVLGSAVVSETLVLSTCNRLEVYAEVSAFHPAVAAVSDALGRVTGHGADALTDHLYVRYDDSAVAHAFTVACGLDSMAVGESQILGQMRDALAAAQSDGLVGESLNTLFQQALRVGKRAHTDTDIDRHSVSLVEAGLEQAVDLLGPLDGLRAAVVGAGAMSGLAVATLARAGIGDLTIVNRTAERAGRLAESSGGRALAWAELPAVLAGSDLVLTCTGSVGHVLTGADLANASRERHGRPQLVVDLAMPRDVEPTSAWSEALPEVSVLDLEDLGRALEARSEVLEVGEVSALVTGEVADYLARRREKSVAPTVAALRRRAAALVTAEMDRLEQRLPGMDDNTRAEVGLAIHRIVEKLLHAPTRKVKEFAVEGGGADYAAILSELFDLEPRDVANVSVPPRRAVP